MRSPATTTIDRFAQAESWLAGAAIHSSSFLFVIGLGQGHLIEVLNRRGWRGRIVALEPGGSSPLANSDRLAILVGPDYDGLDRLLGSFDPDCDRPVVVGNPEVMREFRASSVSAAKLIARAWFGARANQEAKRQNGGRYLVNTLRNARAITREGDAGALSGLFPGIPALIVGAGPSLDRNLPDIVRHRDRVVIVAADTALRPLIAAGVEPDFVVAADPTETNARHLSDLPPCPQTSLVCEGSVDPAALSAFTGQTFFFRVAAHHPWPWFAQSGITRGRLRCWGSVLTTAFDLALVMKCDPIVFAGADLAFTENRPYARGTTYEEVWHRAQAWGQPVEECWSAAVAAWPPTLEPGIGHEEYRTAPHLRSFRDWIADEAGKQTGRSIVNGTGAGILIGPRIMQANLDDALAAWPIVEPAVRARIADAYDRSRSESMVPAEVDSGTFEQWKSFAGNSVDVVAIKLALGWPVEADVSHEERGQEPIPEGRAPASDESREVTFECTLETPDLAAAITERWRTLGDADRLVLVDRTGTPAGAAVRRALFAFLEQHPGVTARHGRFFDAACETSWIDRRTPQELFPGLDLDKCASHHESVAARLTSLLAGHFKPASVLDVGCGSGHWLRAFEAHGVGDVIGVEDVLHLAASDSPIANGVQGVDLAGYESTRRFDLALCLGVVQRTPASTADALVAACTKASDTVVFSVPAAAIGAPGFINERPSIVWHRLFLEHGFAACDELRPLIEQRFGRYLSSYDLVTVYRRVAACGADIPAAVRTAMLDAACRADDLVLQTHWFSAITGQAATQPGRSALPQVRFGSLEMAPARMESLDVNGARLFRCRTAALGVWLAADGAARIAVADNGQPLVRVASIDAVKSGRRGVFAIDRDIIAFSSLSGGDPRHDGRSYTIQVPAHVAWLEREALADILEQSL